MRMKTIAGVMTLSLLAGLVGCNAKPISVVKVDQSVLPAAAKAQLSQAAVIDYVEEETYSSGTKNYVLHYTLDGKEYALKVLDKDALSGSKVLDRPPVARTTK